MSWQPVGNIKGPKGDPGDVAGAPVVSVFGRIGNVVAVAGDYTAAQVTNAISALGSYSDPTWLTTLSWSKITGAPAYEQPLTFQHSLTRSGNAVNLVGDIAGTSPGNQLFYGTNAGGVRGWYAQSLIGGGVTSFNTRTGAVVAAQDDYSFAQLSGKPTTLAGYGITDAYTKAAADAAFAPIAHTHTFASLTSKPTTLAGYGITDAQPLDADLTAIAALTTQPYGRGFLTQADAAAARAYIGAGTGGGDVSSNTSISVDGELALFNLTSGKSIKRATGSGIATIASGVLGTTPDNHANWDTAFSERAQWNGGATNLVAATGRTSLGGTTLGQNFFTVTNPNAIRFFRSDASNGLVLEDAATHRASIGAGTGTGDVVGPAGGVANNQLAAFADATGKLIKVAAISGGLVYSDGSGGLLASKIIGVDVQAWDADLQAIANIAGARGDVMVYGAAGWTKLAAGSDGYQLTTHGAGFDPTWELAGGLPTGGGGAPIVYLQTAPAVPNGTTSLTGMMMGLAGMITPVGTGKVFVTVTGSAINSAAGGGVSIVLRYGTGAAPANGVSATGVGTFIGTTTTRQGAGWGVNMTTPFSLTGVISGLTPGTPIWLDLAIAAVGSGLAFVGEITIAAFEIPTSFACSDGAYPTGWNGDTLTAPSRNAVFDALQTFQPLDTELTQLAGLASTTDNFIVGVANAWAARTPAQVRTTLGLTIGTNVQAWDTQLDSLAALSYATNALKVVRVNAGETGFELATISAGTGDVVGPAGAVVDSQIALFNATTGKLIKGGIGSGLAKLSSGVVGTITDNSANWDIAFTDRMKWDTSSGLAGSGTASQGRTALGATTVGGNLFTLASPASVSWLKITAVGGVVAEDAATTRTSLGLGTAATQPSTAFEVPLTFQWSISRAGNTINLAGDTATPSASQYYGTNAAGARGWYALPAGGGGGSGDVVGPASSADNAIARFDTTTGKLIQSSGASVEDGGNIVAAGGNLSVVGLGVGSNITGFYSSGGDVSIGGWNNPLGSFGFSGLILPDSYFFRWSDTALARSSTGVVEVNNLTIGQWRDLKIRTLILAGATTINISAPAAANGYFLRDDGTWQPAAGGGGGNVSNSGTPVTDQLALWTNATTIKGVTISGSGATISLSTTGVLSISAIANASLANSSITIAGTAVALGGSISVATLKTNLALTAADVGLGNVTNNAQTQAAIVPNTAPAAGRILVGNAGGTAYAPVAISGSGATISLSSTGTMTISGIANASLASSSMTIAGVSTSLGGSITQDQITGLSTLGLVKRTAANTLVTVTDNSANWDTAFTNNLRWDGGATGLTPATGRASLAIGDAAVYENASAAGGSFGNANTLLLGSTITLPAGAWQAGGAYHCAFDMLKTPAGTQAITVNCHMGTLGTASDAIVATLAFVAGTAVAELGTFDIYVTFKSVGSGTSAVVVIGGRCTKNLFSATGLVAFQNASAVISSGFNSTTQTKISLSFNGGASFSGTNTFVQAQYRQ